MDLDIKDDIQKRILCLLVKCSISFASLSEYNRKDFRCVCLCSCCHVLLLICYDGSAGRVLTVLNVTTVRLVWWLCCLCFCFSWCYSTFTFVWLVWWLSFLCCCCSWCYCCSLTLKWFCYLRSSVLDAACCSRFYGCSFVFYASYIHSVLDEDVYVSNIFLIAQLLYCNTVKGPNLDEPPRMDYCPFPSQPAVRKPL